VVVDEVEEMVGHVSADVLANSQAVFLNKPHVAVVAHVVELQHKDSLSIIPKDFPFPFPLSESVKAVQKGCPLVRTDLLGAGVLALLGVVYAGVDGDFGRFEHPDLRVLVGDEGGAAAPGLRLGAAEGKPQVPKLNKRQRIYEKRALACKSKSKDRKQRDVEGRPTTGHRERKKYLTAAREAKRSARTFMVLGG